MYFFAGNGGEVQSFADPIDAGLEAQAHDCSRKRSLFASIDLALRRLDEVLTSITIHGLDNFCLDNYRVR